MDDKDKRAVWIIGTSITAIVCGCPGLCGLLSGVMIFFGDKSIWVNTNNGSESDLILGGTIFLCLGLFMTAVPVVIAFFTFRRKKPDFDIKEPIPPAI